MMIIFDGFHFRNTKFLAKGGFGEVYKAIWIKCYDIIKRKCCNMEVVLKRIYNSNDKIVDILKEILMLIYYYYF